MDAAILGTGWITQKVYLPYLIKHKDIQKIFIYDPYEKIQIHEKLVQTKSINTLLDKKNINMFIIASPNCEHFSQLQKIININRYVICEKPIAINSKEIMTLKELYNLNQDKILFSVPFRFRGEVLYLKQNLFKLGTIYKINARWLRQSGIPKSDWHLDTNKSGGGVLVDLGPHILDLLFWLLDNPKIEFFKSFLSSYFIHNPFKFTKWYNSKHFEKYKIRDEVEDNANLFMKLGDTVCNVELAWCSFHPEDIVEIELFGQNGYFKLTTLFGFSLNTKVETAQVQIYFENSNETINFSIIDREECFYKMLDEYINYILLEDHTKYKNFHDTISASILLYQMYDDSNMALRV